MTATATMDLARQAARGTQALAAFYNLPHRSRERVLAKIEKRIPAAYLGAYALVPQDATRVLFLLEILAREEAA